MAGIPYPYWYLSGLIVGFWLGARAGFSKGVAAAGRYAASPAWPSGFYRAREAFASAPELAFQINSFMAKQPETATVFVVMDHTGPCEYDDQEKWDRD
jgi:hypothetical protein